MPKGSRNRKVWICLPCNKKKLYSRRAWASHLWDVHRLALPTKVRFPKHKELNDVRGVHAP